MKYLSLLTGTWLVVSSNFPIWLKPGNSSPQLHYSPQENGTISEKVTYIQNGIEREISGTDTVINDDHFKRRGNGFFFLSSNTWSILLADEKHNWMVVRLKKSFFSPQGLDIVARRQLTIEEIDVIKDRIWKETNFGPESETLVNL